MTRALLLEEWPVLSYLFHIRPWEVDMLSTVELNEYLSQAPKLLGS